MHSPRQVISSRHILPGFALVAFAVMFWRWGGTVEDSLHYFHTAQWLRGEMPASALVAPFPYRIAMPALAAALPGDLRNNFALVNWASMALAAWLVALTVRSIGLGDRRAVAAGLMMLVAVPTFWYAPYLLVDPGAICARTASVLAVVSGRPWFALGAGLAATAIREENILLLAWLFAMRHVLPYVAALPRLRALSALARPARLDALPAWAVPGVLGIASAWLLAVRWWLVGGLPSYVWAPSFHTVLAALADKRSLLSLASAALLVLPLAALGWRHAPPALRPVRSLLVLMALPPLYAALCVRVEGRAVWSLYPFLLPFTVCWRASKVECP
jgi:hypothetical protein